MKRSRFADAVLSGALPYQLSFLVLMVALLPIYRHQINPDGISYISIAQHYLAGRFGEAVNGYWGPLLSWLLTPLLALRLDPLLAGKLLAVAVGLFALAATSRFYRLYLPSSPWLMAAMGATTVAYVAFACQGVTPDFLVVAVLVTYLAVLFGPDYARSRRGGLLCGLLGALAYLSKAYALFFFAVHFALINALMLLDTRSRAERRRVLGNFALGVAVCAVAVAAWGAALSHKYGYATIGTTGRYNHALVGPGVPGHPMLFEGFMAPSNADAHSVWEDPSRIAIHDWSLRGSPRNLRHQLALVKANLRMAIVVLAGFSPFALLFVMFYAFACVKPVRAALAERRLLYPLLTLLIYPAGYLLIAVQDRYLFPCVVVLNLMGAVFLERLARGDFLSRYGRRAALALFVVAALYQPARSLAGGGASDERLYRLSRTLRAHPELTGPLASNGEWEKTVRLAWFLGMPYHGQQGRLSTAAVLPALAAQGVRWYIVWNETPAEHEAYGGLREILGGTVPGLRIYDLGSAPHL